MAGSRTVLGIGPGQCSCVFPFFSLESEVDSRRSGSADQSSDGKVKVAVRVTYNVG